MIKIHHINKTMLLDCIKRAGVTREYLCKQLHLTYPSLQKKIDGSVAFMACEITAIQQALRLQDWEVIRIFIREVK